MYITRPHLRILVIVPTIKSLPCVQSGTYYCPNLDKHEEFIDFIQELPSITRPTVFGLNDNADLVKEQQESDVILTSVLSTQVQLDIR